MFLFVLSSFFHTILLSLRFLIPKRHKFFLIHIHIALCSFDDFGWGIFWICQLSFPEFKLNMLQFFFSQLVETSRIISSILERYFLIRIDAIVIQIFSNVWTLIYHIPDRLCRFLCHFLLSRLGISFIILSLNWVSLYKSHILI